MPTSARPLIVRVVESERSLVYKRPSMPPEPALGVRVRFREGRAIAGQPTASFIMPGQPGFGIAIGVAMQIIEKHGCLIRTH